MCTRTYGKDGCFLQIIDGDIARIAPVTMTNINILTQIWTIRTLTLINRQQGKHLSSSCGNHNISTLPGVAVASENRQILTSAGRIKMLDDLILISRKE